MKLHEFFLFTALLTEPLSSRGDEVGGEANTENEFEQLKIWLQATREKEQSMRSRNLGLNTETIVYKFFDLKFHILLVNTFHKTLPCMCSINFS